MTNEIGIKYIDNGDTVTLSKRDWGQIVRWLRKHGTQVDVGKAAIKKAKALERKAGKR